MGLPYVPTLTPKTYHTWSVWDSYVLVSHKEPTEHIGASETTWTWSGDVVGMACVCASAGAGGRTRLALAGGRAAGEINGRIPQELQAHKLKGELPWFRFGGTEPGVSFA